MNVHCFLWADHLASLPKRGVGALLCILHLTTKECPCLCAFSDSLPEKFAEVLDNSNIQQSHQPWKLTFWQHKTLWMVKYHHEHNVASLCGPISQLQCKVTLSSVTWSFPTSDIHSTWCCASQHSKSVLWLPMQNLFQGEGSLSKLWPYMTKSGDGCSLRNYGMLPAIFVNTAICALTLDVQCFLWPVMLWYVSHLES